MKRVLITGATGFVGANLLRRLIADGHEVHALVRPGASRWRLEEVQQSFVLRTGDLDDQAALARLVQSVQPNWIFHLAAASADSRIYDRETTYVTNLDGTLNLLAACAGVKIEAFVHAGSSSEYGIHPHPCSEQEVLRPITDYGVAKAAASLACLRWARRELPAVVLRLYSVYGPWEDPQRLIPCLVRAALSSSLPPLASPDNVHDFVFVDDVISALIQAADKASELRGEIFNIGTGRQTSLRELVAEVQSLLKLQLEPVWGSYPDRSWDTTCWCANVSAAQKKLNWTAETVLRSGLQLAIEWQKQHVMTHGASTG